MDYNYNFLNALYNIFGKCYVIGQREGTEATKAALEALPEPLRSLSQHMLKMCVYAGTGDVLVIQEQLQVCSEHYPTPVRIMKFLACCNLTI